MATPREFVLPCEKNNCPWKSSWYLISDILTNEGIKSKEMIGNDKLDIDLNKRES